MHVPGRRNHCHTYGRQQDSAENAISHIQTVSSHGSSLDSTLPGARQDVEYVFMIILAAGKDEPRIQSRYAPRRTLV